MAVEEGSLTQGDARAVLALGVMGKHNLQADPQNTLLHHDVAGGLVNVKLSRPARGDEEARLELHRLGTLHARLARDDHLDTLSPRLHHEADDAIASPPNLQTSDELELERLGLGHGRETAVVHALSEHLDVALGEAETLLHSRSELPDPLALLTENLPANVQSKLPDLSFRGSHSPVLSCTEDDMPSRHKTVSLSHLVRVARMMISVRMGVLRISTPE